MDPNSSTLSLAPVSLSVSGIDTIDWQEVSFRIDTGRWRPTAGTVDQYVITIVAPGGLNQGRSLGGIDKVTLFELSGTLFRRIG